MDSTSRLNREAFVDAIRRQFPEVAATWNEYDSGLIHLEVAAFRRCVETAMDHGRLWDVERYGRFVMESFANADDALENAIGVSFVEDFALGEITEQRRRALHERMPKQIRDQIIAINRRWR